MANTRRTFIKQSSLALAALTTPAWHPTAHAATVSNIQHPPHPDAGKISVFSKNLQWLDYSEMARVAADIGFDGIDLTVRPKGHVEPERVADDLPKAVAAIRSAGLQVYSIVTAITGATEPYASDIVRTAGALGIKHYRMGWLTYDNGKSIEDNLSSVYTRFKGLAELNARHKVVGEYQNHSGTYFGAPLWDLHQVLQKVNSPWLASQYDIYHATVEGFNAWPIGLKLLAPYIRSIDLKDFAWAQKDGKWIAESAPLGEGLIDFQQYFQLLKTYNIQVPISMHYEYALGGVENGATTLTIPREQVVSAMKRDLETLRRWLA